MDSESGSETWDNCYSGLLFVQIWYLPIDDVGTPVDALYVLVINIMR